MRLILFAFSLTTLAFAAVPETPNLSFDAALEAIVQRHPSVGIQKETLESVKAKNLPLTYSLLPSLSLQASHSVGSEFGPDASKRGIAAKAGLNLFRFGADLSGIRAASSLEKSQIAQLDDAVLKAEDDGVRALVTLIQTSFEIAVVEKLLKTRADSLKVAKERFDRGLIPSQEVDKVSIDYDNDAARLKDLEIDAVKARADLVALLGHDQLVLEWPWKNALIAGAGKTVSKESDLSARPDWRAAEASRNASLHFMDQAWGQFLPSIDLNLGYGYSEEMGFQGPGSRAAGADWSAMALITIPLFDKLEGYGNYRSQVHLKAASELTLEKTRRFARSDWATAKGALEISLTMAQSRDKTLEVSRQLYKSNLSRFQKGLASANELTLDQDRLFSSELFAIRGWSTAHLNYARLCHSLGKRVSNCH